MNAAERLRHALFAHGEQGQSTPCQGRRRDRWTSDDRDERAWAASVCTSLGCPLLALCGAAADEASEPWGVWAGVDRAPTTRRANRHTTASRAHNLKPKGIHMSYIELTRPDGTPVMINLNQVWAVVADPENHVGTLVSSHTGSLTVTEPYTDVRRILGLPGTGEAAA